MTESETEKIVLTYGTFDMFHIGHLNLLKGARALGSRLVVGVSDDEFNAQKGKDTFVPFADRAAIVAGMRYVDEVFAESSWEQKRDDIRRWNVSVLAMGDDWAGKFDDLQDVCRVVYLPRTIGISTTDIKSISRGRIRGELEGVMSGAERLTKMVGSMLGHFE
ncbi:adenylyltransferase/cytidyltransferase family protein [Paraburkholderia oxyphila]|uniref:adenylyltransferase/cytidyltransferase family protein n=1 Tax=Paraburkholderia oxyphila TaxID=614212 RepID=UPI0005B95980|nr:adenylyltransferase/cytidyltransferase family protein [Paraburkholderia oxyphila]